MEIRKLNKCFFDLFNKNYTMRKTLNALKQHRDRKNYFMNVIEQMEEIQEHNTPQLKQIYTYVSGDADMAICYFTRDEWSHKENVQEQSAIVFTVEEYNKHIKTIIENALNVAAQKCLLSINGITEKSNGQKYINEEGNHYTEIEIDIDKLSITNTLEETFNKWKYES